MAIGPRSPTEAPKSDRTLQIPVCLLVTFCCEIPLLLKNYVMYSPLSLPQSYYHHWVASNILFTYIHVSFLVKVNFWVSIPT